MASAPSQVSVEALKGRRFSFYPAIRNVEHNEWTLDGENWAELRVVNGKGGPDIWIPRNYVGSVSSSDSPVLIVGLNKELEFKGGTVWPYRRTVIEMPRARQKPSDDEAPAPQPPNPGVRRLESAESQAGRLLAASVVAGLVACLFVVLFAFGGFHLPFSNWFQAATDTADQRYLSLNVSDTYHDVVLKLGKPEEERWISTEAAEIQFQLLRYPARSYAAVLMGGNRSEARYIGTLHDPSGRILDSAKLANGGSTASMLKNLPEH